MAPSALRAPAGAIRDTLPHPQPLRSRGAVVRASQVRGGAVLARARRRRVSGSGAVGWGMAGALNHDRHHAVRPRQHALGGGGETEEGAEVSPQADERPAASRSMDEIQDPTPDNVAAAWLRRSSTVPQSVWQWLAQFSTPLSRAPAGAAAEAEAKAKLQAEAQRGDGSLNFSRLPDELHHVRVRGTAWEIALWRYLPSQGAPRRAHSPMLVPGCASNARSFDLAPKASLARHLAAAGYDTWVVECRGVGLSRHVSAAPKRPAWLQPAAKGTGSSGAARKAYAKAYSRWKRWARERMVWDVDTYIHEDLPVAMDYIVRTSRPTAGRVVGIGHSMGGMLLYGLAGVQSSLPAGTSTRRDTLAGVVTLASGLRFPTATATATATTAAAGGGGQRATQGAAEMAVADAQLAGAERDDATDSGADGKVPWLLALSASGGGGGGGGGGEKQGGRDNTPRMQLAGGPPVRESESSGGGSGGAAMVPVGMVGGVEVAALGSIAPLASSLPEFTHVLPIPVDLVSQWQAAAVLPWAWIVESQVNELWSSWDGLVSASAQRLASAKDSARSFSIRSDAVRPPTELRDSAVDSGTSTVDAAQQQAESGVQAAAAAAAAATTAKANSDQKAAKSWGVAVERLASFDDGDELAMRVRRRTKDSYQKRAMRAGAGSTTTAMKGSIPSPLLRRLLNRGFESVPLALLVQMATLFTPGGLRSRGKVRWRERGSSVSPTSATYSPADGGHVNYLQLLGNVRIPVLAMAGGADPVIPPKMVADTVSHLPTGRYICCGNSWSGDVPLDQLEDDDYFSHYDLLAGIRAPREVYTRITAFLESVEQEHAKQGQQPAPQQSAR